MEADLSQFLALAGLTLGEVTQRVLAYLSVQDLIEYVAVASNQPDNNTVESKSPEDSVTSLRDGEKIGCRRNGDVNGRRRIPSSASCVTSEEAEKKQSDFRRCGKTFSSRIGVRLATEGEIPHNPATESGHRGGDKSGGSLREAITQHTRDPSQSNTWENINDAGRKGGRWRKGSSLNQERRNHKFSPESGLDIQVVAVEHHGVQGQRRTAIMEDNKRTEMATQCKEKEDKDTNILGILIGLGMKPLAAFGAIKDGLAYVVGGVPLLSLLQWAAEASSSILGVTFRIALLPYDVSRGVVVYVMRAVEAMLNVAKEIWCELQHLNLGELAKVLSCMLNFNALPGFLLNPLGGGSTVKSTEAPFRIMSRFSRRGITDGGGSKESSGGHGLAEDSFPVRSRSQGPSGSDGTTWRPCGVTGSAGEGWREAHAIRRRFDRVNRAASLVSYQEGSESGSSRAKAPRVRQHMHYAMSLQCFQATVTKFDRDSPAHSNGRRDDDELEDFDDDDCDAPVEAESREGSSICTPQSFPPTPNSRAHVMAHTSRFADDVIFLARDQLRLRENLKPGVDETTRATANFLRRQRCLAVLDGGNVGEGIVLTCGHHRATKIGPSLYSSARAMVPVLRNRYVYFQVSCERDGSSPSVGVGLSTPEMPLSTLVGAFSNSIGLCSTGQVLMSSRWYGVPEEYALRKTGPSTVGVLVYLDDSRFSRSWDGDMVRALVCFSIDGRLVRIASSHAPPLLSAGIGASLPREGASPCYSPTAEDTTAGEATTRYGSVFHQHVGKGDTRGIPGAGFPDGMPGLPSFMQAGVSRTVGNNVLGRPGKISRAPVAGGPAASAAALGLALPSDRDLFPTVTINSTNTEVLCRFCAEDLLSVSRESMGAPPGVPVYALDGSLINV